MPDPLRVEIFPHQNVTMMSHPAATKHRAGVTLILGHGAGAGQTSDFIVSFAGGLAARGIDMVTFNFLYREQGRRIPDPNDKLEACWRRVIEAVREQVKSCRDALAIGGKSMGGRIASQVAAGGVSELAGLVFLGYPLHPPGRPDRLRAKHLSDVKAPMLFVQGSRDAFGTPDELRPIVAPLDPPRRCLRRRRRRPLVQGSEGNRCRAGRYLLRDPGSYRSLAAGAGRCQESTMSEAGTAPRSKALRASH
jgi:predicted alpha/beta-hydrolase family hydrolase